MRGSHQAGGSTRLHALQLLQALGVHRVHAALGAVLRGCAREHRGGAARGGVAARARVARTVSASVSTISADSKCCRFMSRSASRRSAITRLRFSGGVPEPSGAAAAGDAPGQPREPLRAKKTAAARVGLTVGGRGLLPRSRRAPTWLAGLPRGVAAWTSARRGAPRDPGDAVEGGGLETGSPLLAPPAAGPVAPPCAAPSRVCGASAPQCSTVRACGKPLCDCTHLRSLRRSRLGGRVVADDADGHRLAHRRRARAGVTSGARLEDVGDGAHALRLVCRRVGACDAVLDVTAARAGARFGVHARRHGCGHASTGPKTRRAHPRKRSVALSACAGGARSPVCPSAQPSGGRVAPGPTGRPCLTATRRPWPRAVGAGMAEALGASCGEAAARRSAVHARRAARSRLGCRSADALIPRSGAAAGRHGGRRRLLAAVPVSHAVLVRPTRACGSHPLSVARSRRQKRAR